MFTVANCPGLKTPLTDMNAVAAPAEFNIRDYFAAVTRRHRLLLGTMLGIFVFAGLLALLLPAIYRSEAVILIEQQEIPTDMARSTVTSYADQRIQVISQRVMTSSNLT